MIEDHQVCCVIPVGQATIVVGKMCSHEQVLEYIEGTLPIGVVGISDEYIDPGVRKVPLSTTDNPIGASVADKIYFIALRPFFRVPGGIGPVTFPTLGDLQSRFVCIHPQFECVIAGYFIAPLPAKTDGDHAVDRTGHRTSFPKDWGTFCMPYLPGPS